MKKRSRKRANNEGSIFYNAKRKEWVIQITVGYNPLTGKTKRRTKYAKTQSEALDILFKLREKYSHNLHIDADQITVGEWFNTWLEIYKIPKLRENTLVSYKRVIDICVEAIGYMKLEKVQPSDLQYIIYKKIGPEKFVTCRNFRTVIKQAFKRAVQDHLIVDNPAEFLELPPKPPKRPFIKPTIEDWKTLLNYPTGFYGWQMAIYTVFLTGVRRSELLALRWDSFSISRNKNGVITGGTVVIDKSLGVGNVDPVTGRKRLYIGKTKSENSIRKLPLPAEYCQELMAYKKKQAAMRLASPKWEHPEMVFTTNDGRYYNPDVFSSIHSRVCRENNLKFRFHDLRHDMATSMKASHRFDFKDIQTQLGHSNIQITLDTYTHMEEDDLSKVGAWIDERLKKLKK